MQAMNSHLRQFITLLEEEVDKWQEAAAFYEKYILSVRDLGSAERSGQQEADRYRARADELEKLIETLRKEADK